MATRDDIVSEVYIVAWRAATDSGWAESTDVVPKINSVVSRVCKWAIVDIFTRQFYRSGDLPFLRLTEHYALVQPQAATADIDIWDTTISVDCSGFLSSWSVYVNGNVINYTGKNGGNTQLTGVTGIALDITQWAMVYQLYPLPSNISKPFSLSLILSTTNYSEIPFYDPRFPATSSLYYTLLKDTTNDVDLLHVVGAVRTLSAMMEYYLLSTDMATGGTTCIIPDPYVLAVIPPIVAGELLYRDEEVADAKTKLDMGYTALTEMYWYYAKQTKRWDQRIVNGSPINLSNLWPFSTYGRYRGPRIW